MAETHEQTQFVKWCLWNRQKYHGIECVHSHVNEGKRSRIGGHALSGAGLRKGFPDIEIPAPGSLFLEFKFGKGKMSRSQEEWRCLLLSFGHDHHVVYSSEEAEQRAIEWYENKYPDLIRL